MESNNSNESNSAPVTNNAAKKVLVKRIKVPTVRQTAPSVQPAPEAAETTTQEQQAQPETSAPVQAPVIPQEEAPQPTEKQELPPENKTETKTEKKEEPSKKKKNANKPAIELDISSKIDEKKISQLRKIKLALKWGLSNRWIRLGVIVALLGTIFGGIYSSLPVIAEKRLPALFAANGVPFQNFKLKEMTIDTMELTNVSDKTGTLSISSIKFNYSLADLYSKNTIRSMTLSGITVKGERREDGISLGALDSFIYSPIKALKGKELSIKSLKIQKGTFVLKDMTPHKKVVNEDGEEVEVDETISVQFSANGSLSPVGLNMMISTQYASPVLSLKTETNLNKTAKSSHIKTEITEGNLLKKNEKIGSVTGNLEIAVDGGVLSTGLADLLISSSSQKLKLNAGITPKESGFDIALDIDRSFDDPKDAIGKFVGKLSAKADNVTIEGTFQSFNGTLPLQLKAETLTNGQTLIQNLETDMDLKFSCTGTTCSASLTKPMKFAFSGLQTIGLQKQIKIFTPMELTINPDPAEPFLKSESHILTFTLPVNNFQTSLFLTDSISSSQIATAFNGLKTVVKYNIFNGAYSGEASFQQSGYVDKDIRLSGIQGVVSFVSNSLPNARLRVAKAVLTKPDILPEFSADVRFRPAANRGVFNVDSVVSIQNGLVTATLNGSYSLPAHEWDMYLVVPKFLLSEESLKLSSVLPFMQKYLPDATTGAVAAKGRLATSKGAVIGPLNVLLENINTTWNNFPVESLNGVVTLTSLSPLATPENQQLYAGVFNVGIPFEGALFNFHINADRGIEIANMRMKYADGQFKTIKSFFIPYDGQPSPILLEGNGINLSLMAENLKSSSLQVDGIANSEWRLSFTEDKKLSISQAVFATKLPGTLHFTPSEALRKKMDPQMTAYLKDVIVKSMKVTAKGQMDGPVSFAVSIKGHSPLDSTGNDQDVSFDFKSSFKNLFRQKGKPSEIPADVLSAIQGYSK